jgi:hypothetical protein
MAQPSVGVSFKSAGLAYLNNLLVSRGGRWQVLARDYGGSLTNISPGSSFVAPMALDGKWRDDLFAIKRVNGRWVYNLAPNCGFYPVGYVLPEGIERAPKIDSDPLDGLQALDPVRVDMQKRSKALMFTPMERNLVVDALRFNQPLTGLLERAAGSGTYFAGESTDDEPLRRQIIVTHEDKQGGLSFRNAFPFPKCVLTDLGSEKGNRKDADAAKFTLSREICPFFVDSSDVPLVDGRWSTGEIWDQNVVPGLTFVPGSDGSLKPVATPTAATTATLVFPAPIGGTSPYTYTVAKSASSSMTSPSSVTVGSTTVANGVVTLALTGLTTSTTSYFQVTVTDDDSVTAVSAVSNSATQP